MKLSFTFVGALAVVAHGHGKDHSYLHKNGTSSYPTMSYPFSSSASPSQVGISSGLAPYPSPSISSPGQAGLSTGVPLSTGATPTIYTTTKIVSVLTTFCPATPSASALTITQNSKTYTLTVGETTTIYDCPCTSTYTTTGYNVSTPTQSGDTTLIYTIGTGSSTSVVTTTVRHTSYQTNTAVSYFHVPLFSFGLKVGNTDSLRYLRRSRRREWRHQSPNFEGDCPAHLYIYNLCIRPVKPIWWHRYRPDRSQRIRRHLCPSSNCDCDR